ncbi:hypothetical protein BET03_09105 [Thermohalobacter berrensis]|uniref:Uncharacterized protein n=1 Tax=Thermohalobacter berrensis TaxID=99594 RepID=A0A419T7I8_9FIRM|nr:hypothetical protein BET03_09105 [Thermohalobacter berrensis]
MLAKYNELCSLFLIFCQKRWEWSPKFTKNEKNTFTDEKKGRICIIINSVETKLNKKVDCT